MTEAEYKAAIKRIEELFDVAQPNTPEGEEFVRLVDAVIEHAEDFSEAEEW